MTVRIPEGWKPVPVEPTEAMIEAGQNQHVCRQEDRWYSDRPISESDCVAIFKAMVEAAPTLADAIDEH